MFSGVVLCFGMIFLHFFYDFLGCVTEKTATWTPLVGDGEGDGIMDNMPCAVPLWGCIVLSRIQNIALF